MGRGRRRMGVVVEVGASHRLKKLSKKMANCRQHERNKKYGEKRRLPKSSKGEGNLSETLVA